MGILAAKVPSPTLLLLLAGMVMVITLWFSSRAKNVVKTSIDLSNQEDTKEKFSPTFLSRGLVRLSVNTSRLFSKITSKSFKEKIDKQFEKPVLK